MKRVVSFDIFDTAVIRIVNRPCDVFSIVEKEINREYGIDSNYGEKRINAEKKARIITNRQEIRFEDIYRELDIDNLVIEKIKEKELKAELLICRGNPVIYEQYKNYIEQGYRIIFTSDMYLEKSTIKQILHSCGYLKYEEVYVSSEIGLTKGSGDLYKYILDDLNIKGFDMLHIGNNFKTDILTPQKYFIHTKWYLAKKYNLKGNMINQLIARISESDASKRSVSHEIGYSIMGPMTIGFCDWIHNQCDDMDRIFFLSRDGYVLHNIYHSLFPQKDIAYLRVSRKALRNAIMSFSLPYKDFCKTIPPFKEYSGRMMLELFGIRSNAVEKLEKQYAASLNDLVKWEKVSTNIFFEALYQLALNENKTFYVQQRKYFKEYLLQSHFTGNVAVVDLSFKGTAFNLIKLFCEHEGISVKMDGYVIGKSSLMRERIGEASNQIHGWIFESEADNPMAKVLISSATLYERFLFDSGGTTLSYTRRYNKVEAILDEEGEHGNVQLIGSVRSGIEQFVYDIKPLYELLSEEINAREAVYPLLRYILWPKGKNVSLLGDLVEDNVIKRFIAKPKRLRAYICHPKVLFNDIRTSFWKQGFLYRLFRTRFIIHIYNIIFFKFKGISRVSQKEFFRELR